MILDGALDASVAAAVQALRAGELVGLPTETVYGLAADAGNDAAVAAVFARKGRPADHPLIVHVADAGSAQAFAGTVPDFAQRLMNAFWPGPLTLILPRRSGVAAAAAGGQATVGLRCPSHPVARRVLQAAALAGIQGLAAPSANRFGRVSPTSAAHVQGEFGDGLLVLDGGSCEVGIESTIVDCSRGAPALLRPGAVTRAQVEQACGRALADPAALGAAPRASGTLEAHYAPDARVRLMDARALQAALDVLGSELDAHAETPPPIALWSRTALRCRTARVLQRRMPDDPGATAHQLFAVMREFDARGVRLIWIETPPDTPEWDGVRDRLSRAAAAH